MDFFLLIVIYVISNLKAIPYLCFQNNTTYINRYIFTQQHSEYTYLGNKINKNIIYLGGKIHRKSYTKTASQIRQKTRKCIWR